jgi:hypothetical protein
LRLWRVGSVGNIIMPQKDKDLCYLEWLECGVTMCLYLK